MTQSPLSLSSSLAPRTARFDPRVTPRTWLGPWGTLLFAVMAGCGDGDRAGRAPVQQEGDAGLDAGLGTALASSCEGEADGVDCGRERHCVRGTCAANFCGDGVPAGDEQCDDGNERLGDDCTPSCLATPVTCGDARLDPGEECDDGNLIDVDSCATSCTSNVCGNGRLDPSEECDDGNRENEDYCSLNCVRLFCRNGVLDPGEECDDGNTNPNDGCSNACEAITCGDGVAEKQEECDDGNRVDTDDCANRCTRNVCNNGRIDPGEFCDQSLTASGQPIPAGSRCEGCKSLTQDSCRQCEESRCGTGYLEEIGFDWFTLCHTTPPEGTAVKNFTTKCTAMVECMRSTDCDLWDPKFGAVLCYCGKDTTLTECGAGMKINGPCIDEIELATESVDGDYTKVLNDFSNTDFAVFVAQVLGKCRRSECAADCQ